MQTYTLEPQDLLFFRDGRPIETSGGHGARWPEPSVIFDALHRPRLLHCETQRPQQPAQAMKNLEQIHAAAALGNAPTTTKAAVSKLPAIILANGLLATAAFASETKKDNQPRRKDMKAAMDGAAQHLANPAIGILVLSGCQDAADLIRKLCGADSVHLHRATSEALAFIGYLKRFTTKEGSEEGRDE